MSNVGTYFSTLSADELWTCWQQLGKIYPALYVGGNPSKVQFVCGEDAPFARIGQFHFKHLYLDDSIRDPAGLGLNDDEAAIVQIIRDWGQSFTHFHAIEPEIEPSAQVLEVVRTHCTSIKSVCLKLYRGHARATVASTINAVLESNCQLIEDLDVGSNLSFFTSGSFEFPKLKALSLDIIDESQFHLNLIRSCRSSLQRVRLRGIATTDWREVINVLHSCVELRAIDMKDEDMPDEELSNLLISRGPLLEYACVESLSDESCREVAAHCPNFKCDILATERDLKKASILGTRVKSIKLFYSMLCDVAEMDLVSNRCTEMESFCSQDLEKDGGSAHAFFGNPKPELRRVHLQLLDLSSSSQLINRLSSATTSLRVLSVVFYSLTQQEIGGIVAILQRNRNLEEVSIHSYRHCELREHCAIWVKILHLLRGFRMLKLVRLSSTYEDNLSTSQFSFWRSIAKAVSKSCVPFRNRGVLVQIWGLTICK